MYNKFVKWLFGVLGFSGAVTACDKIGDPFREPVAMYGCPSADYVFNVDIVDGENDAPIEGIRVSSIARFTGERWDEEQQKVVSGTFVDTLAAGLTSADGKVVLRYGEFPVDKHEIVADDIDGTENGGNYNSSSVILNVERDDYKEGGNSGWYLGTATEDLTLKLTKKE